MENTSEWKMPEDPIEDIALVTDDENSILQADTLRIHRAINTESEITTFGPLAPVKAGGVPSAGRSGALKALGDAIKPLDKPAPIVPKKPPVQNRGQVQNPKPTPPGTKKTNNKNKNLKQDQPTSLEAKKEKEPVLPPADRKQRAEPSPTVNEEKAESVVEPTSTLQEEPIPTTSGTSPVAKPDPIPQGIPTPTKSGTSDPPTKDMDDDISPGQKLEQSLRQLLTGYLTYFRSKTDAQHEQMVDSALNLYHSHPGMEAWIKNDIGEYNIKLFHPDQLKHPDNSPACLLLNSVMMLSQVDKHEDHILRTGLLDTPDTSQDAALAQTMSESQRLILGKTFDKPAPQPMATMSSCPPPPSAPAQLPTPKAPARLLPSKNKGFKVTWTVKIKDGRHTGATSIMAAGMPVGPVTGLLRSSLVRAARIPIPVQNVFVWETFKVTSSTPNQ
ncbi:MAG: putative phosphoprotein [Inari rhabdovirus]|uniref:Phosphoprotein n=1 Tax=Inari rhabdovirus TaxID=2980584 RepID=A0AAE9T978_9RHAB|nr:MAG: putative phosphoprotein [Inari rhabdovirus]